MEIEFIPAKASEVKAGDILIAGADFTCMPPVARRIVKADADGDLFVDCADGQHFLSGQLNKAGECSGFTTIDSLINGGADKPEPSSMIFIVESVIENTAQRIFTWCTDREGFEGVDIAAAHLFADIAFHCHDEEAVRIGILPPEDMHEVADEVGAVVCDDCRAKAH
jgi:hypothetical protein